MNSDSALNRAAIEPTDSEQLEFDTYTQSFRLGDWQVDPQLNQLKLNDGSKLRHLEPRLAKLLSCLASQPMKVVERDTLVNVLWPKVIVNENSLTRAVSELRKLLSQESRPGLVYIETIPKRGYRLRLPVQPVRSEQEQQQARVRSMTFWHAPAAWQQIRESALAALCLALTLAFLLQTDEPMQPLASDFPALAMSDELVYSSADKQLRDEIILSSSAKQLGAEDGEAVSTSQAVVDQSGGRFAYIQYDHTGSTLYLGEVESTFDPVPVFNSGDILFNLAWSPLENALLFASKPTMTTTALFDQKMNEQAKLYSFDLESFRLSVLVEQVPTTQPASESELSLT